MRGLTLLGSTGSIGTSTLAVVAQERKRFEVVALTAHANTDALVEQCLQFRPQYAVLAEPQQAERAQQRLRAAGCTCEVLFGAEGLEHVATLPAVDTVVAGIVGAAGLRPSLAAVQSGKRLLLANKEALVMAGEVFMAAVREHGATLLPIDSEHNAIHQALPAHFHGDLDAVGVRRIVLTASGGPFRLFNEQALEQVSVEQACAHPNWVMGRKNSVDSATMMNKGLEVIEARWLFGAVDDRIAVVIHPQSIVHSMVEYADGSILAQLGHPDMRTPIAQALAWPERVGSGVPPLDLAALAALTFEAPDPARFPCLELAYAALRAGGAATIVLNAANEIAVAAFLGGRASYPAIAATCAETLDRVAPRAVRSLDEALVADADARRAACSYLRLPADAAGVPLAA